jgi:GT2 family glycosyltransferase
LLINNDAVAGPSLVSGLLKKLKENPAAALVAPRIVSTSGAGEYGFWYHRYLGLLLSHPRKLCFRYLTGCCLLFKRELVESHGLFDEAFFMYCEDAELGWRLAREDRKMICAADVFVRHDLGPSARKAGLFYEYHMARGHMLLGLRTWIHPMEIPLILMAKSFALGCRAICRCFRYRTFLPLAAFFLAWFPLKMKRP